MLIRDFFLLPLIVSYMLVLVVAALPSEIRPSVLDAPSLAARKAMALLEMRAGMQVFPGKVEKRDFAIRYRCIVVTGTDSKGEHTLIYPTEPCPVRGFRWKPEIYRHMIFHWMWMIRDSTRPWNLWAMGDHFCHSSPNRSFRSVTIRRVVGEVSYETGRESTFTRLVGRVKCRS